MKHLFIQVCVLLQIYRKVFRWFLWRLILIYDMYPVTWNVFVSTTALWYVPQTPVCSCLRFHSHNPRQFQVPQSWKTSCFILFPQQNPGRLLLQTCSLYIGSLRILDGMYLILIQHVACFLSLSLGKGIENTQFVG